MLALGFETDGVLGPSPSHPAGRRGEQERRARWHMHTRTRAHTGEERPRVPSQSPVLSYRVLSDTRSKSGRRAANCEVVTMTALPPILETGPWRPDGAPSAEVGLSRGRGLCADEPAVKAPFSSPEPRAEAEQERIQQGQETASVGPGPVPREGD